MNKIQVKNKQYISYSEMNQFYYDKEEYYLKVILGVPFVPTPPMELGSILHYALENEKFDYKKAIRSIGLTSDYERIADKIMSKASEIKMESKEEKIFLKKDSYKLFGVIDTATKNHDYIADYKTGKSAWTQEKVDENEQITFYNLMIYGVYKKIPKASYIHWLHTGNGKVKTFETSRTLEQLKQMDLKIKNYIKELKQLGWFDKRISSPWIEPDWKKFIIK